MSRKGFTVYGFTNEDLAKAIGQTIGSVHQHRTRKRFDPYDFESVVLYVAQYGRPELQAAINQAMLRGPVPQSRKQAQGETPQTRRPVKKTSKRTKRR